MIIDSHVHVGRVPGFGAEIDDLIAIADRAGIDRIFCTHLTATHYDMFEGNRLLAADMRRYPNRVLGYASITSARYGGAVVDEIVRCVEVYGMRGLKMLHRTGGLGSATLITTIAEPAMYPIVAKAAELRLPILAHASPNECEALSREIPEAVIVMAHSGGHPTAHGDWHRAIEAAGNYPNLYLDTASSMLDMGYIEAAVTAVGAEQVIFGTDTPLLDPFAGLAKVTTSDLTDEDKELILGGNMARLLGL